MGLGGFPGGTSGKETASQCREDMRDMGSIPGLGRSPGGGHGNPLHPCLENPMDRGAWQAAVLGLQRVRYNEETWQACFEQYLFCFLTSL